MATEHAPLKSLPLTSPRLTPLSDLPSQTDITRWRLTTPGLGTPDVGRHLWTYLHDSQVAEAQPQTTEDKIHLDLSTGIQPRDRPESAAKAAENGYLFYQNLQSSDGHFAGEYGGPLFLLPGLVVASYVTNTPFPDEWRIEITRYLQSVQRKDGGWGLHIVGPSTVFGTTCNYVVLRLLGNSPDLPFMVKARNKLHALGGATGMPSWGKTWMAVLGVYDWQGVNPVPPELLCIPDWMPIHPWRWWIHTRMVYIPMSWLWGRQWVYQAAEKDPLIASLRQEIYTSPYRSIKWPAQRNNIAAVDVFAPHTKTLDALFAVLGTYAKVAPGFARSAGLSRAYDIIRREDENTGYQCLGPVNKMLNQVVRYAVDGPDSDAVRLHREKVKDFMWMSKDGLMMCGTNGSQLWDTAFVAQAVSSTVTLVRNPSIKPSIQAVLAWLKDTQITENPKHYRTCYRHPTKGAWPFSTKQQGYTVSDCTAEGMKAVLDLQKEQMGLEKQVPIERLYDSVDLLVSMQNADGGFASYETINGPAVLEWINPAEVFGGIMIEYSYPECTTSVIGALCKFRAVSEYRREDIDVCVRRAVKYILAAQRPDGSWFGSWAVCFTYATMFALECLHLAGYSYSNCPAVRKACEFLVSKQNPSDNGWGEAFDSCVRGVWVDTTDGKSRLVQTSWAVIALLHAEYPHEEPIRKGCRLIMDRQLPDGSWQDEECVGVFNRNCGIVYPNYRFSFTIWALGRATQRFGEDWRP
ncbi:unnamed protein product [Parajaminaea phylloscopi]